MQDTSTKNIFGHPLGLFILFFTEMWERFSFYGMRAILVLYLVAKTEQGGLGWTQGEALSLYGWYTMLVYLMSIPGGYIADNFLGQKRSVMAGGLLLVLGHSLMAYPTIPAFYCALGLIILGVGLLKPNISTMVGGLYGPRDGRRDSAFTIFYMGINIGAFLSSLIVGYVGERIGWHYGFALAGVGMALGQIVFMWGQKHLKSVGNLIERKTAQGVSTVVPFTSVEKDRLLVLLISFLIVIVFWTAFEQAGGFMNLYADQFTNRWVMGWEVPASWFQALNPAFIIIFGGVIAALWVSLAKKKKEPSAIFKLGIGTVIMGIGFILMVGASIEKEASPSHLSNLWWLVGAYWFHTIGELALSPVSLAYITKLAPPRVAASMMGIYFAATGLAQKLAAWLGSLSEQLGDRAVFAIIAIFSIGFGFLLVLFTKKLNRLAHDEG